MKRSVDRTKLIGVAITAVALVGGSAGAAFAGEIKGTGEYHEVRGKSICAFSGLNDERYDPEIADPTAPRVQSWGQIPKAGRDFLSTIGFHPGDSCNGHTGFGGH